MNSQPVVPENPKGTGVVIRFHPKEYQHGDGHHTDEPFTEEDRAVGYALAYYLGTLFADVDEDRRYFFQNRTSVDEWSRVARALRIHGLAITDESV